ncbi:MAG TPA: alcohol dehydrogenase catalytic domain-containing protein [Terriglobales bacterium]|nr:alcohol dehydrogenase catalytic domain-containing protein [Terriglobales bacterium]
MKALLYTSWDSLEIADVPKPVPGSGEVLVQVHSCGICGSELDSFRARSPRRPPPLIMGHEFCGVIVQRGPNVTKWKDGDRVISHALVHCGECPPCVRGLTNMCTGRQVFGMHRPGAFGEYVSVPEQVLLEWPASLTAGQATMAEPLANGINVIEIDPSAQKERVIVIGAGPIGLMCMVAAHSIAKSSVIVSDLIDDRLEVARKLGAAATFNPQRENATDVIKATWGSGTADYVIDAVGSATTKRASLDLVRPGGAVVWIGLHDDSIELSSYAITLQQKRILGTYSGSYNDMRKAISILSDKTTDVTSWVKLFPLDQGVEAFQAMLRAQGDDIKGILSMPVSK